LSEQVLDELPRTDVEKRRREVMQHLADHGLLPRSRWWPSRRGKTLAGEPHVDRVRAVLEGLGPVFSALGIYLSTRPDLLPAEQCLTLSTIPDRAAGTPADVVRDLIECELGADLQETFPSFEAEPFESRLLCQSHRARLSNNQRVVVEIVHPEILVELKTELGLLELVAQSLGQGDWAGMQLEDALDDFRRAVRQQTDLTCHADALRSLSAGTVASPTFAAPRVYGRLCTAMMLTRHRSPGSTLSDLFEEDESAGSEARLDGEEVAETLVQTWLRHALAGRPFPEQLQLGSLTLQADGRIGFTGGLVASLTEDVGTNVWDYVIAAAEQNPDRACDLLFREMERSAQSGSEVDVRVRFRQIIPFRDGGWSREGANDNLAEHLFLQWRTMRDHGYRIRPDVLGFFRGLFAVTALARRLAPERDFLLEQLMELRRDQGLARLRQRLAPLQANDVMQNISVMMTLPYQLDQALTHVAKDAYRSPGLTSEARDERRNHWTATAALLFLVGMVVLWGHQLSSSGSVPQEWIDLGSTALLVLLGALLLRMATSSR
jgi:ubiquinone biosynthesis protein